eukprot:COSAG06_NODE_48150_length_334_cov_0.753191_1_plen_86_part_01
MVNDTSDNTGAGTLFGLRGPVFYSFLLFLALGAPGDATNLLRAVLECPDRRAGRDRCVFGQIYDPAIAAAAHEQGVGAELRGLGLV